MATISDEQRRSITHLLSPTSPEDALTAYYALYHKRTQLFTHGQGVVVGFLAVCQTAHDLFTPLVVMRSASDGVLAALLESVKLSAITFLAAGSSPAEAGWGGYEP